VELPVDRMLMWQCVYDSLDSPCTSCKERGKQCGQKEKTYGRVAEKSRGDNVNGQGEPLSAEDALITERLHRPTGRSISVLGQTDNGTHSSSCVAHW